MQPDFHVICVDTSWATRGALTTAYLEKQIPAHQRGRVIRFRAVVPADFVLEDVATTAQTSMIRGITERLTLADMSHENQVGCYLSHRALWEVCVNTGKPIVVVEDDARPVHVARRLADALQAPADAGVVTMCMYPYPASVLRASEQLCRPVKTFVGAAMYYVTPKGASVLLAHSLPAAMHVDMYMSLCIATYNLPIYAVPGAGDQSFLGSTLNHGSWFYVVTVRTYFIVGVLSVVVLVLAITVAVVSAKHRRAAQTLARTLNNI